MAWTFIEQFLKIKKQIKPFKILLVLLNQFIFDFIINNMNQKSFSKYIGFVISNTAKMPELVVQLIINYTYMLYLYDLNEIKHSYGW